MASSSYAGGAGIHLQTLVLESVASAEQKADCLKLLKVVIKNLADPVKSKDAKYRQLKLDNAKVKVKLLPFPSALDYLKAIGFDEATDEEGARILRMDFVNIVTMSASLMEVSNALDIVLPQQEARGSAPYAVTNSKPRVNSETKKVDSRSVLKLASTEKLSEKQKARLLMEQKVQREKEEARKQRASVTKLIKQDKYVRKHDANWKSGVCAAAGKSGDSISTFRDRHGES